MDLTRKRLERGESPASHKPTASTTGSGTEKCFAVSNVEFNL